MLHALNNIILYQIQNQEAWAILQNTTWKLEFWELELERLYYYIPETGVRMKYRHLQSMLRFYI